VLQHVLAVQGLEVDDPDALWRLAAPQELEDNVAADQTWKWC